MGRSAKIRHRRRRRLVEMRRRWELAVSVTVEKFIHAPLRTRRLYPLGFVPVLLDEMVVNEIDAATERILSELSSRPDSHVIVDPASSLGRATGVMNGAPADAVKDCEELYDEPDPSIRCPDCGGPVTWRNATDYGCPVCSPGWEGLPASDPSWKLETSSPDPAASSQQPSEGLRPKDSPFP